MKNSYKFNRTPQTAEILPYSQKIPMTFKDEENENKKLQETVMRNEDPEKGLHSVKKFVKLLTHIIISCES